MGFPLTDEQRIAVENQGGGLLVAAAAGSGKTRVLVERLLRQVEEGADIDRFLVITYTKAAAAELRGRIAQELSARLAERPGDRHLRRQAILLYKAQISTIHAFCAQLLREHGHLLDLEADLRLCDESEAGALTLQAMDQVLEERYAGIQPQGDFARLLDTMSAGRDDSRLVEIAIDIYHKVQSHPDPGAWLAAQAEAFELAEVADAGETVWGRLLLAQAAEQVGYWAGRMEEALALCRGDEKLSRGYAPSIAETLADLRAFQEALSQGWDRAAERAAVAFPRLGAVRGCEDPAAQERIKSLREMCKKRMGKLAERFADGSEQLLADLRAVAPAVRGLFALVEDLERSYTALKRRRRLLDFSDLEHLAGRLLREPDGTASELAERVGSRYAEVMVDEYQDTNEVQNTIFDAVSMGGKRLFMVGDVKQSIYRFRLADPTIFLGKYRTFPPYDRAEEGESRRVLLTRNFRSRPQVLEGVNFLFRNLMSVPFGEMDYTADEALYPGGSFPGRTEDYAVELDALDLSEVEPEGDSGERKPGRDLLEARFVARRIRELLDSGFPVTLSAEETRPVEAGDVVILLRSPNTVLGHYARALGEQGLAWEAEGGSDFLSSTEVSVTLSCLRIIDNPRQDVPLISVLRSPVWGFSADRLAQIRAAAPDTDFYGAMLADGGEDVREFLDELDRLRDLSCDMSCQQLLWEVYDRFAFLGVFGGLGDGETRRGNLLALAQCARDFESAGHKGLYGFLSYLDRVLSAGGRLASPGPAGEGNGIRILSIHRSKGLEFPVVFLCGLSRRLNREDMQKPMLFHPKLGVGPKGLDPERMVEFTTLARQAVAAQLEREMMAEELRLLYVAMTRAKDKLILTCALTGGARDLRRLAEDAACPVDPQALLATQSVAQWVLLAALVRPDAGMLRQAMEREIPMTTAECGPAWDIRWVEGSRLGTPPEGRRPAPVEEAARGAATLDLERLTRDLSWRYPHLPDTTIPSKLTATQLKGRHLDQEAAETAPQPPRPILFPRPRFAAEALGLTSAQRGTALHLVMQFLDFAKSTTKRGVTEEIGRLVQAQIITPQQGEAVDPERIAALFASPLGRELLRADGLQREFKFSILAPARDYYPQAGEGEEVLLQGVVDCWFETLEGITVVDFKTDRVGEDGLAQRAESYRSQLTAYSRALEEITGRNVARKVLWFFHLDRAVEL